MTKLIRLFTKDTSMFSKDTILNGGFRITPETRIEAEPAPKVAPGDMGVRLTGNPGPWPQQVDIDQVFAGYEKAHEMGMLTREQVAQMKADLLRANGGNNVVTNAVGVSRQGAARQGDMVKWKESTGVVTEEISALTQDDVNDLQRLHNGGAISTQKLYEIRAANRKFSPSFLL